MVRKLDWLATRVTAFFCTHRRTTGPFLKQERCTSCFKVRYYEHGEKPGPWRWE